MVEMSQLELPAKSQTAAWVLKLTSIKADCVQAPNSLLQLHMQVHQHFL